MIVDSSVLVSIALDEPGSADLVEKIAGAPVVGVGAPTLVEAGIVLCSRLDVEAGEILAEILAAAEATVVEFGPAHWREAISAWRRFGKSRHPARLNLGDCLSYAVARVAGEPLLAVGGDFAQTDVALA